MYYNKLQVGQLQLQPYLPRVRYMLHILYYYIYIISKLELSLNNIYYVYNFVLQLPEALRRSMNKFPVCPEISPTPKKNPLSKKKKKNLPSQKKESPPPLQKKNSYRYKNRFPILFKLRGTQTKKSFMILVNSNQTWIVSEFFD